VQSAFARVRHCTLQKLARAQERYGALAHRLARAHPGHRLQQQAQRLDDLEMRLRRVTEQRLVRLQERYAALAQRLARVHPGNKLQQQSVRLVELEAPPN
jgi:exodeoxyribonuclease VII large subunit